MDTESEFCLRYIDQTLQGESASRIRTAMLPECRAALLVPVYNEDRGTILRCLMSVAEQTAPKERYEVAVIVNNSRQEAVRQTFAYRQNRRAVELLEYLQGKAVRVVLTPGQRVLADRIRASGLRLHTIDKSSSLSSYEENTVGTARNRAGAELAARFLSVPAGFQGIIAMTDCDTRVSDNFFETIINTFEENPLNGLAGRLNIEIAPGLRHGQALLRAYELYLGARTGEAVLSAPALYIKDSRTQSQAFLVTGPNMAVTVRSWCLAGGMPRWHIWEDQEFGARIERLPGHVGYHTGYSVTPYLRPSLRAGMHGFGRLAETLYAAILKYPATGRVRIPDPEKVRGLMRSVFQSVMSGTISGDMLGRCLASYGFLHPHDTGQLAQMADTLLGEHRDSDDLKMYRETNRIVIEMVYPYAPLWDITDEVRRYFDS